MIVIAMAVVLLIVWGVVATILALENDGYGRAELAERNRRAGTRAR